MTLFDRDHMRREGTRVFPPLIPLTALLVGWGLDGSVDRVAMDGSGFLRVMGVAWAAIGLGLMVWSILHQVRRGTDPNPFRKTSALVIDGPYRFSRNPIYLADLCIQTGVSLLFAWEWGLLLLPVTWASLRLLVIRNEERFLALTFGDEYVEYRACVRRWF